MASVSFFLFPQSSVNSYAILDTKKSFPPHPFNNSSSYAASDHHDSLQLVMETAEGHTFRGNISFLAESSNDLRR